MNRLSGFLTLASAFALIFLFTALAGSASAYGQSQGDPPQQTEDPAGEEETSDLLTLDKVTQWVTPTLPMQVTVKEGAKSSGYVRMQKNGTIIVETEVTVYARARGRYVLVKLGEFEFGKPVNVNVPDRSQGQDAPEVAQGKKTSTDDVRAERQPIRLVLSGLEANRNHLYSLAYISRRPIQGIVIEGDGDTTMVTRVAAEDTLYLEDLSIDVYEHVHVSAGIGPMYAPIAEEPAFRLGTNSSGESIIRDVQTDGVSEVVFGGIFHPWGQNPYRTSYPNHGEFWRDTFFYLGIPVDVDVFDTYYGGVGWGSHGFSIVAGARVARRDVLIQNFKVNEAFQLPADVTDVSELTRSEWARDFFIGFSIQLGVFRSLFPEVPVN